MLVLTHCASVMFGMDILSDARIVRTPACLGSHAVLVQVQSTTWTTWAAYAVYTSACGCTYALFLYNVFGMDSPGEAPIVRMPACLGLHAVLVPVQYLIWTA